MNNAAKTIPATNEVKQEKPNLTLIKQPKYLRYSVEELRKSIEQKQKRKTELLDQIKKLDQKIQARQARLNELLKK